MATRSVEIRVSPVEFQIGDRFRDQTGEWEVIGRPFTTAAGRNAHVRVRKVGSLQLSDLRTWEADEQVSVRRYVNPEATMS